MNRKIKLFILVVLSLSVYFIYKNTFQEEKKIIIIGDRFAEGINSYGIKEYSYLDYYKEYLENNHIKVTINNNYIDKNMTIFQVLDIIKFNPTIKRNLQESNLLIINTGYNDLMFYLSLEKTINEKILKQNISIINHDYKELLKEIKKYYKGQIIIIGYYPKIQDDYYKNVGIKRLNKVLQSSNKIDFIDTSKLLKEEKKFFLNPKSDYPNHLAYQKIAQEIITKTLEK